jgi:hypothetical protein
LKNQSNKDEESNQDRIADLLRGGKKGLQGEQMDTGFFRIDGNQRSGFNTGGNVPQGGYDQNGGVVWKHIYPAGGKIHVDE